MNERYSTEIIALLENDKLQKLVLMENLSEVIFQTSVQIMALPFGEQSMGCSCEQCELLPVTSTVQ
jgi:hypothetical protein